MLAALSTPDIVVAVVCALFAVRGLFKGFAWQAVRTVGIIGGFLAAGTWHEGVGEWLERTFAFLPDVATPWIAWIAIFMGVLLLATWFAYMAKGLIKTVQLGGLDRLFGFALGGLYGLVLVTAGFLVWGSFVEEETLRDTFEDSITVPYMARLVDAIEPMVPEDMRRRWGDVLHTLHEVVDD